MRILNGCQADTMRTIPAGTWFLGKSLNCIRGPRPRLSTSSAVPWPGISAFQCIRPRGTLASVRTVEDIGAGRIGIDARAHGDPFDLFREEWILRDVWLRPLDEPVRVVELLRLGQPDDLGQRFLPCPACFRVALRPPRDAPGGDEEGDDCCSDPQAA